MRQRLLVALIVAGLLAGCVGNPTPSVRPAILSEQLALAVERAQTLEIELHRGGQVSDVTHRLWQRRFLVLGQGIQALNAALRARALPAVREAAIRDLLETLQEMTDVLVPSLDFDNAKLWLHGALEVIRALLVTASTQPGEA